MDDTDGIDVGPTSQHNSINSSWRSSHDSVDSGYQTLTPHSISYTPVTYRRPADGGYRTRSSVISAKKHYKLRRNPWQCGRRPHFKVNYVLNASESDYLISEQSSILDPSCVNVNQSLSLVHSTPSCADQDSSTEYRGFGQGLGSNVAEIWKTALPVASSNFQILSPPPSPAVPSSSYATSEPIEKDAEMKLVLTPDSTSQITTSPKVEVSTPWLILTTPACKKSTPALTSEDNGKLNKLSITNLGGIKPKKLDFTRYGITKSKSDYTGKDKVDLLCLLGEKSNHWRIISKILSFLGPQDLCSIHMVSKTWSRICESDSCARMRRMTHILCKYDIKENLEMAKKAKLEESIQTSLHQQNRGYLRKGCLVDVKNLLQVPRQSRPPNSPPVSPSKVKFHSFVKASRTLAPWEHLLACPRCSFACHVDGEKKVAICSRQGCSIEFCSSCSSKPHIGPCKTPLLATPTKRNKRLIVGSRQSKRNLRRL